MAGRRKSFGKALYAALTERHGAACSCCKTTVGIEWHHIVPLFLGGTDEITNIVPLCHACHMAAHHGRDISHYDGLVRSGGRHPKVPDEEAFRALDLLLAGEIGNKRCKELMGLSDRTQPFNTKQAEKYFGEHSISRARNNLDVALTNSSWSVHEGRTIGEIEYIDGRRETILFHDTGANDSTVYSFCRRGGPRGAEKETMTWGERKKLLADEFSSDIDRRYLRRQSREYALEASAVYGGRVRDPQVSETPCAS